MTAIYYLTSSSLHTHTHPDKIMCGVNTSKISTIITQQRYCIICRGHLYYIIVLSVRLFVTQSRSSPMFYHHQTSSECSVAHWEGYRHTFSQSRSSPMYYHHQTSSECSVAHWKCYRHVCFRFSYRHVFFRFTF